LCLYIAAFYFDEAAIKELDLLGTFDWLLDLALYAYLLAIEKPLNFCQTP